jgi:hypothetical protein
MDISRLRMVGRFMGDKRKSYTKEYIYLIVSALVSYYLIQLQQGTSDDDIGLSFMWNVVKVCRRIEVFFAKVGDSVYRRLDSELENRRTI